MNYPFNPYRIRLECVIRNLAGGIIGVGYNGSNIIGTVTLGEVWQSSGALSFDINNDHVAEVRDVETAWFSNFSSQIFLQGR